MQCKVALYFRDQLREARVTVFRDAEAYLGIVQVIERLGSVLPPKSGKNGPPRGLGGFGARLLRLSERSPWLRSGDRGTRTSKVFTNPSELPEMMPFTKGLSLDTSLPT
jgi:hypothetical protein